MAIYFTRKAAPSEDALTGMLVDLMRWGAAETLTRAILRRARPWGPDGRCARPGITLKNWTEARVRPWPTWPGTGEPDLVVDLLREGSVVGQVVVEAKFGAGKSGTSACSGAGSALTDQLARYAAYPEEGGPASRVVLYVTHHPVPPSSELRESVEALMGADLWDPARPSIAWLSWKDIEIELSRLGGDCPERALRLAAGDAAQVLRANGFFHFTGSWTPRVAALDAPTPRRQESSSDAAVPRRQFEGVWRPLGVPAPQEERPSGLCVQRLAFRWKPKNIPPLREMTWTLRR